MSLQLRRSNAFEISESLIVFREDQTGMNYNTAYNEYSSVIDYFIVIDWTILNETGNWIHTGLRKIHVVYVNFKYISNANSHYLLIVNRKSSSIVIVRLNMKS